MNTAPPLMRAARQLRGGEIDQVVARFGELKNIREVARELGMSRTTIAKHLANRGVKTSRGMTEAEVDRAVDLYGVGKSSGTIGKQLGFDNHTALAALRARSVPIRTPLGR